MLVDSSLPTVLYTHITCVHLALQIEAATFLYMITIGDDLAYPKQIPFSCTYGAQQ